MLHPTAEALKKTLECACIEKEAIPVYLSDNHFTLEVPQKPGETQRQLKKRCDQYIRRIKHVPAIVGTLCLCKHENTRLIEQYGENTVEKYAMIKYRYGLEE